jgi:hypothetical protein
MPEQVLTLVVRKNKILHQAILMMQAAKHRRLEGKTHAEW